MQFIDFSQRDSLSIIVDIGSLVGWTVLGGFLIKKVGIHIRKESNLFHSEKNQSQETKIKIFWGAFEGWSKTENKGKRSKAVISEEIKTEEEIRKEI